MASSNPHILVDGQAVDHIPASDRGLAYGHGLFETIRMAKDKPLLWKEHLERLKAGCTRLRIEWRDELETVLRDEVAKVSSGEEAIVKILITSGSGGRGYRLPKKQQPRRLVARYPLPEYSGEYYSQGIAVRTCQYRLAHQPQLAGLKHLNRLDQVMASTEWRGSDYMEGMMLDQQGNVIEGTRTNLFGVEQGRLVTPKLDQCGVAGVMRRFLLEQAAAIGLKSAEVDYSLDQFKKLPELFVCNSVIGIWPIRHWDQESYAVGDLTERLQTVVDELFGSL